MNMNVFLRELKFYRKSLIFWSLAMVLLIWSSFVKYDTLQNAGQSITDLMKQFPATVQTIFGLTGFDLSTQSGFYGVMYMYIALTVTIHAVLLGAGIISKEERDKTSEFLFVKPAARSKIITAKLLAGIFSLVVLNIVTLITSIIYFHKNDSFVTDIYVLMAGMLFMQLVFYFIGAAISAISRRPKLSASMAAGVLLITFIMTYVINFDKDLDFLKYATPFKYFDAKDILANGHLDGVYIALSLVIVGVMTVLTYVSYNNRDLEV